MRWPALHRYADAALHLIYPPLCLGCETRLIRPQPPVCPSCLSRLERAEPRDVEARLQNFAPAAGIFARVFCCWMYAKDGTLQRVHQAVKYGDRPRYGEALGRILGGAFLAEDRGAPDLPEVVIPVPLHRLRYLERGYNQAESLARGMAAALEMPHLPEALVREHPTRSQTALSREERWRNVADAFSVADPTSVAGRGVLLVDDILTTGATLTAAARALQEGGASSIQLATLAMAR